MEFNLDFSNKPKNFNLEFEDTSKDFNTELEDSTLIPCIFDNDHRLLSHRDAEDQHPIEAVKGLRTELDSCANKEDLDSKLEESDLLEFSNTEIQALWNQFIK